MRVMIDTNIFISVALFPNGSVAQALYKAMMTPVCYRTYGSISLFDPPETILFCSSGGSGRVLERMSRSPQ